MSERQTILDLTNKISILTQELPLLETALETRIKDKQLAVIERDRLSTLLQTLQQQENDIIKTIEDEIKQSNTGLQYKELFERYQTYKALSNSTSDSLKMQEAILEVFIKILKEEHQKKNSNNYTTDINTQISSAKAELKKATTKLSVINKQISDVRDDIFDKRIQLEELTKEKNELNMRIAGRITRIKQKKKHKSTKKDKKKGGKWSIKYKRAINCKRPKGFSQKQYCKYKK